MDITKIIGTFLIAVLIGVTSFLIGHSPHGVLTNPDSPKAGSLAGPNIPFNYLCVGGQCDYSYSLPLTQAASTTCSIQSPAATSTLVFASVRFDVASSGAATIIELGKGTFQSTTTLIGTKYNIAAGAQAYINGSTTPQAGDANVFAPNQWFNVKVGGGIAGSATGFVPTGNCQATFVASQ